MKTKNSASTDWVTKDDSFLEKKLDAVAHHLQDMTIPQTFKFVGIVVSMEMLVTALVILLF